MMKCRACHRAFTLTELLVVFATLALLLGVLLPALANTRTAGRTALCTSNLRQMALAAQRYALEYQFFPPALRYENDDGVIRFVAWDWVTTSNDEVLSPGALWSFTDDPDSVQQCPEYHGETNYADPYTGYNYNTTYVGGETETLNFGWEDFRPGARYSACRHTARVAIFGDGGMGNGGTNKFMRAPLNTVEGNLEQVYAGGQAFRHGKGTVVAYLDGHVDRVAAPHKGELATDELLGDPMGYPGNGFLSNDDRAYDPY